MVTLRQNPSGKGAVFTAEPRDANGALAAPTSVVWTLNDLTVLLLQGNWGGNPLMAHVEPLSPGDAVIVCACGGAPGTVPVTVSEIVRVLPPEVGPVAIVTLSVVLDQ